ncbi:chemotaxis protein CheW (plasmid) [Tundrisphaera lichenicola]|uniref:chemotaxis protein CheW n=1 Tax=Tundrisphaera lichenicola TaxID=2029860 RepID=UPI003EBC54A6
MSAIEGGPGVGDCWNRIGVDGDGTCPELKLHDHCRNCPVFAAAARGFFERKAPEGYLAEWAELLGRPVQAGSTDSTSLLVFRLGREWLALSLSVVAEVTEPRPVHRVPHRTNRVLSGLVSLRGQLQLCVSMHGLLEVDPPDPSDETPASPRLVVIRQGTDSWTFPAEEVVGVQSVPLDRLEKVPSTLANPAGSFSRAVFAWGSGRSVDVLDEPRIFQALRRMGA